MMTIIEMSVLGQFEQEPLLTEFYRVTTLQPSLLFRWGERIATEKIESEKRQRP
jgi:hypothetical protein